MMKLVAAFDAAEKVAPEKPAIVTAFFTPGTPRAISLARRATSSVRWRFAPSGSCTTRMA